MADVAFLLLRNYASWPLLRKTKTINRVCATMVTVPGRIPPCQFHPFSIIITVSFVFLFHLLSLSLSLSLFFIHLCTSSPLIEFLPAIRHCAEVACNQL
eukprot:gene1645-1013_t